MQAAAQREAENDLEIVRALVEAHAHAVHKRLGMASLGEYVEKTFMCSRRTANERIRVARALTWLPEAEAAFERGTLKYSVVKEVSRVATGATEEAWIAACEDLSIREVEAMVSGRRVGDLPSDRRRPEDEVLNVVVKVRPETFAAFHEALAFIERAAGRALTTEQLLLEMSRIVLAGPTEEGRSSYQIAIDVCRNCGRAEQQGGRASVEVANEILEMAMCDAQVLPERAHVGQAKQTVSPSTKRAVRRRFKNRCGVGGCSNHLFLDIHHIVPAADGGTHDESNLVLLCGTHHRLFHRGSLLIRGRSESLEFSHPDGTPYGVLPAASVDTSQAFVDAHEALRALGFRQTEIKESLDRVRGENKGGEPPSADTVLREALSWLR